MSNTLRRITSIVAVFLVAAAVALGQNTTGSIEGTIKDANGAVIPGASVSVSGSNVGFSQTVTTNSDGVFRLDRVPIGTYRLTVAAIKGFAETTVETTVNIEKTTSVDISLSTQVKTDVVVVSGDPLGVSIDTSDSKNQTNITSELIDKLPMGTSFSSVLKLNPATRGESLTGGFTIAGASKAENTFSIDGQDVTNVRHGTLNENGTGVDNQNIPTALIKEIQIKTGGFEAEHGGASGGVIQIATKSGSDQFHGGAGAQFTSSRMQPDPNSSVTQNTYDYGNSVQSLFALPPVARDASLEFDPSIDFSGPIFKKHLWFYGIYSPQTYNATRVITYYSITPSGQLIQDPLIGTPGHPTTPTETYVASQSYEYAEGKLNYSFGNNLSGFTSYLWNPFKQSGLFPYGARAIDEVEPFQAGYPTGPELYKLKGGFSASSVFNTQMTWTPASWLVLNGRFGYGFQNSKPGNYASGEGAQYDCIGTSGARAYTNNVAGCTFGFSSQSSTGGIVRNVSAHKTTNIDASFFFAGWGRHSLKGGYELAKIRVDVFESSFNNIQMRYGQASGNAPPCNTTASLQSTCYGYGIAQLYGEGAKGANKAQALYVQDKWQINRLTLNLGVRSENENLPSFSTLTASTNPINIPWSRKTVPRLGAAFDLFGDGKTRIYGNYGIFSDRMKFEMPIGSFGGAIYYVDYFPILAAHPEYTYYTRDKFYGTFDPSNAGNPSTAGGIVVNHRNLRPDSSLKACGTANGIVTGGTCSALNLTGTPLNGVDPNLKPFSQQEFGVGFETELWTDYVFGANYNRRDLLHTIDDNGYGRDAYYTIGNPGEGLAEQQLLALGYPGAAKPTRIYNALEFSFTKRFTKNYFYSANYTWSRLWGNYSGLANSDYFDSGSNLSGNSATRSDPGVNRFYDWSLAGYSAHGGSDSGLLATDRTHVFKAYGGYAFDWFKSRTNETMISFFQVIQSGTPQTTAVEAIDGSSMYIVFSKRGDMGRTPKFSQTDLTLSHSYKFGTDGKFKVVGDITVNNAFNQHVVTAINPRRWIQDGPNDPGGSFAQQVAFEKAVATGQMSAFYDALDTFVNPNTSNGSNKNLLYGQPSGYQGQRNIRFGFRFEF